MKRLIISAFAIICFMLSQDFAIANGDKTGKEKKETACDIKVGFEFAVENLTVKFTNVSVGNWDQVNWSFGDKQSSEKSNPVHTYEKEGDYKFCITATNSKMGCSEEFCGQLYVFE